MQHVAIMKKSWGLLEKIRVGQKVIESRWYQHKMAPWDKIQPGEVVYFKNTGEPVSLKATVVKVLQFENLTPARVKEILVQYCQANGIEPSELDHYYELFQNKCYCILVFLTDMAEIEPFHINKTGHGAMSAWLTISSVKAIKI